MNKNEVDVTVRHGGNEIFISANQHQKIQHILDEALRKFKDQGIVPPPNNIPFLRYGSTDLSDLNRSLADYGIPDKAVLDLLFRAGGGY